jgi:chromosome segregation protein
MRFQGQGVAAVVGPNGCGKSNLSDAISWVLGEQSAKSLRGARMEDVIFAGTRDRKPLGMAQVTMTMSDPTGTLVLPTAKPEAAPTPENAPAEKTNGSSHNGSSATPHPVEFTITRRLYRSGESDYLINGRNARLRDIQELFMGTGLGPESYAIIEQGRIGQILSSKPLDRRAVIEEAAGISKFKTKRRLAEAKLEGAKQNLARVFDILEEVSRQVNSLKRQAGKARRFEELKGELDTQLRVALTGRYGILEREAARVAIELNSAARAFQELNANVEAAETALGADREACYRTEAELTAARQRLSETRIEAERARGVIVSQAGQVAGIEQRLQQGEAEFEQLAGRLESLEQERARLQSELEELHQQASAARERLASKTSEREAAHAQLTEKERTLEQSRQHVVRLVGEASFIRNQVGQIDTYLDAMERDIARVAKDGDSAQADLARLGEQKSDVSAKLATQQAALDAIQNRRKSVDGELTERRARALESRKELDALKTETSHLRARRDSLEEILSHRAYTTDAVKRLFTAVERGEASRFKPAGVLADFIDLTHPQFEKATEEFLHEELEYVVVKAWDDAQQGIDVLRGDLDGRATFLVEPSLNGGAPAAPSPVHEPAIGPDTGIVGRLSDGIRFTNGLTNAPAALIPRLARCFLAESREAAQRLALQYPDLFFLLSDGVCYHGHAVSGGKRTGTGPLALKRELREISSVFQERQAALEATQEAVGRLEAEIHTLSETLENLRVEQQEQERSTLLLDQQMRKLSEEFERATQKLAVSRMELERLNRDTAASREEREKKQILAEERERERVAIEGSLETLRAELESARASAASIAEEQSVLRVDLAGLEERHRGVEGASSRLSRLISESHARRESLTAEMGRLGVERQRLFESNLQLEEQVAALAARQAEYEAQVAGLEEEETRRRAGLAEAEESIKANRLLAAEAQDKRAQIELDLVRRQSELKYLDETCRKDLGLSVAELTASSPAVEPPPDEIAVAEAEEKVSEIRRRIEALGPVNPEALSEYREAQQRYDFLNTQRQDLLDSIRDTEKAIHDIDTESRRRFVDAFHAINEYFKEMFRTLFGGGTGEMRLTGEGDALDQGIEIVASPPGKRLQSVLLLSGGEKALTAIALLMAIFKYQPSPFCILDEVDAPLDEANVGRFTQLIKDMAAHTQFVVITHAKKTMEAAEMLYGVTMQEQGVSKLVSVRLQAQQAPLPETARVAATA